jgi:restriction system protein
MRPVREAAEREAIYRLVDGILSKPRAVLKLHPTNFEHLVMHLLEALDYRRVRVTGRPGDGGIDVEAYHDDRTASGKLEEIQYLVQCKRHSNPVGGEHVHAFIRTLRESKSVRPKGLMVATAPFSDGARDIAKSHAIEFIDGTRLQELLDEHFSPGTYIIRGAR